MTEEKKSNNYSEILKLIFVFLMGLLINWFFTAVVCVIVTRLFALPFSLRYATGIWIIVYYLEHMFGSRTTVKKIEELINKGLKVKL